MLRVRCAVQAILNLAGHMSRSVKEAHDAAALLVAGLAVKDAAQKEAALIAIKSLATARTVPFFIHNLAAVLECVADPKLAGSAKAAANALVKAADPLAVKLILPQVSAGPWFAPWVRLLWALLREKRCFRAWRRHRILTQSVVPTRPRCPAPADRRVAHHQEQVADQGGCAGVPEGHDLILHHPGEAPFLSRLHADTGLASSKRWRDGSAAARINSRTLWQLGHVLLLLEAAIGASQCSPCARAPAGIFGVMIAIDLFFTLLSLPRQHTHSPAGGPVPHGDHSSADWLVRLRRGCACSEIGGHLERQPVNLRPRAFFAPAWCRLHPHLFAGFIPLY